MSKIIGLDLGTTTVSGVLFDAEEGHVLCSAQRANEAALPSRSPSRAEQDPGRLRALALEVLAELASTPDRGKGQRPSIDGIALTGQKHGLLCVDGRGEPLSPLISWQDQRTAETRTERTPTPFKPSASGPQTALGQLLARLDDLDWRTNGCRIAHGYGAATLFWLIEQEALPPSTRWVCSAANWLAAQLTAQPPVMDPTHAASWGIYDLVSGAWNGAFLERLDLDAHLFPPVRPSGERLAGLDPRLACQAGLTPGLPVYNALGDTQAAFLGAAGPLVAEQRDDLTFEQVLLLNLGTGGQICWAVPAFQSPTVRVEIRPLSQRRFLRVGASLCGGAAYAWLNHTVRSWLAEFRLDASEEAVYERLNTLAETCEDMAGLRVRTTFLGVRGGAETAGSIEGITLKNLQLGRLARATLAGMVDELYRLYREGTRDTRPGDSDGPRYLLASGGASHKNPLLCRLIEERMKLPTQRLDQPEVAAMGAAWLVAHPGQV